MAKKRKVEGNVAVGLKQAFDGLGACLLDALDEFEKLNRRLGEAEALVTDLSTRLDKAELRAGIVKTCKVAKGTFTGLSDLESIGHSEGCMCFGCRHPEIAAKEAADLEEVTAQ